MSDTLKTYLLCFLLAISLRITLIHITPYRDGDIDLMIYRATGQLVANGVNPYDFNDNVELREQLRNNKDNYNSWVCSDQDHWNYYTNSNLPLASLLFGGIEYCFASTRSFRYCFAFFDCILAIIILAFVLNKCKFSLPGTSIYNKITPKTRNNFLIFIGFSLGAFSPFILLWGTFVPGPKGIGLLLILSAIYFSDSTNKKLSMLLSPALLGLSVAFIGLGVFIGPLCLYNVYKNNVNGFRKILVYCVVCLITCVICLAPFLPELIVMMKSRMRLAVNTIPEHGSMWALFYKVLPDKWLLIKNTFIVLFAGINIFGYFRKRVNMTIISANLLYLFTCIYLMNGSLDRMNIALASLIILLSYSKDFRFTTLLWFVYFMFGTYSFFRSYYHGLRQDIEGVFVLSFTALYFVLQLIQTFTNKTSHNEAVSSYTSL